MSMVGTLVAVAVLALGGHQSARSDYALVQLTPAATCVETVALLEAGATSVAPSLRVFRLPAAAARRLAPGLRARHALQAMELDRPLAGAAVNELQADPLEADEWWRSVVGIDGLTPPGPGRPVTVVDSGLDLQHPDFLNRPNTVALNPQEPAPLGGEHGTSVSSLIGAPENGVGLVGIYPQAVIRSWDTALGAGTSLDVSEVIRGIEAAAADGPGVINLSLGSTQTDSLLEQAIDDAFSKGSLVVVASGNDGDRGNPAEYPADYPHVLTIAATDQTNAATSFSSRSPYVDLAAPGQDVPVATASDSSWHAESGTSFSTPIVSGAAAWVWTVRPDLDNTQLFEVMRRSATDIGAPGRDDATGYGMLNVAAALAYPTPLRDPREPNDDIGAVSATATGTAASAPLTMPTLRKASLQATLDRYEDPRDVYRIWLPAKKAVRVTATSTANVSLRVWGPRTSTVSEGGGANLLGKDLRAVAGRKQIVLKASRAGRWGYVEVAVGGKTGLEADYSLAVAA